MSWDLTSIPNYDSLELYKTLNPVMVSTFDMGNWDLYRDRAWKVEWRYNQSAGTFNNRGKIRRRTNSTIWNKYKTKNNRNILSCFVNIK